MNFTTSYTKYILSRRATKRVVIFVLVTFIYNFFAFPVHAAEAPLDYIPAMNSSVIKSPASEAKRFERLVSADAATDTRPELVKSFKLINAPEAPKPLMKGKNPVFTDANHTFRISTATVPADKVKKKYFVTMTAYNSEVGQTDDGPCTTANGFNVCQHGKEDTVAANFLPFGTKIMIPSLFGNRIFIVRDRTAPKYKGRVDVWFKSHSAAMQFGKRHAEIIIVE